MNEQTSTELQRAIRESTARAVGAIGLAGVALIHTIDAPSHFVGGSDTWLGAAYVGLIAASLLLAAGLVFTGDRRIWALSAGMVTTTVIGFVLSRTVGLPGDTGDIGNWGEAIGIAALFVEGTFLMLSAGVLGERLLARRADPDRLAIAATKRLAARASGQPANSRLYSPGYAVVAELVDAQG